jgi:hypothetical protein
VRRDALNSTTTVLREGEVPFAQALSDAGHPMPGMRQA